MAMTWYERGFEEGLAKGPRLLLRMQLADRFGPLSPQVLEKVAAWPADKLLELGCALLKAQSLQELGLEE